MPDTFGAKQVATRIGTDPKTFRKFLRSKASPYESVGQGGRYEFDAKELHKIKAAFIKWQKAKRPKAVITTDSVKADLEALLPKNRIEARVPSDMEIIDEALSGIDEPSEAELAEIEDEELEID